MFTQRVIITHASLKDIRKNKKGASAQKSTINSSNLLSSLTLLFFRLDIDQSENLQLNINIVSPFQETLRF